MDPTTSERLLVVQAVNNSAPTTSYKSFEEKMDDYFPISTNDNTANLRAQYLEADILHISNLLQHTNTKWSKVPRLYTVLRLIGQLHLIDVFIALGITDFWFPFSLATLPDSVNEATRTDFVNMQSVVLTKAVDLEKGEHGKHQNFAKDEQLPFQSKAVLGSGAFGQVDKVLSLVSNIEYARKRIRKGKVFRRAKEYMKAFQMELEVLKRLNHRHIVEYVGSYTDSSYVGIIMSPVADGNLCSFLEHVPESPGKKPLLRCFFGCLTYALSYLHNSKIRHKDIKPQNILVKGDNVLFTDFGISLDWTELSQSVTQGLTVMTPRYCAPEVAQFEPRGSSSDIWSLGCVFLEMLTVLKGDTVDDMKAFYEMTASKSTYFRTNPRASEQWMLRLEQVDGTRSDNAPITWIKDMLQVDRLARPTATAVFEMITAPDADSSSKALFCGICCLDNNESSDDLCDSISEQEDALEETGHLLSQRRLSVGHQKLIIALDFGTTFSGIAYLFIGQGKLEPKSVTDWPGTEGQNVPKTPTVLDYDTKDQRSFTWGSKVDPTSQSKLEGVKLLLDLDQGVPLYVPASNTEKELQKLGKPVIDVASDYIRVLYKHALDQIYKAYPKDYIGMQQKKFVLTVPACWSDKAKDVTIRAAKNAGMYPITLIREPEAATLYTMHHLKANTLSVGDAIMLCDAGGGTVDLISYEVTSTLPLGLKELVPSTGAIAGSLILNRRFENYIKNIVGNNAFLALKNTNGFAQAMKTFDQEVKPAYRGHPNQSWFVSFPMANLEDDPANNIQANCLHLKYEIIHQIFEPIIAAINQLVAEQVKNVRIKSLGTNHPKGVEIKAIFLVGGFGSSQFLKNRLEIANPDIHVIQPPEAWSAIAKGAVLSQIPPEVDITST